MKKIVIILICLTIPLQISMILPGIALDDGPFCYWGTPPEYLGGQMVPSIEGVVCSWEIGAFFESFLVLPVTMITLPVMLTVFLIHYVKNRKRIRV